MYGIARGRFTGLRVARPLAEEEADDGELMIKLLSLVGEQLARGN